MRKRYVGVARPATGDAVATTRGDRTAIATRWWHLAAFGLLVAACSSGPSPEALGRNLLPSTTTTTEPPPEGVVVVVITNGRFAPSNLSLDLNRLWIVRWENQDPPREYQIVSRDEGVFESPLLAPGDSFEVDFSELPTGLYRYHTFLGNQRIPGLVDTRPSR